MYTVKNFSDVPWDKVAHSDTYSSFDQGPFLVNDITLVRDDEWYISVTNPRGGNSFETEIFIIPKVLTRFSNSFFEKGQADIIKKLKTLLQIDPPKEYEIVER